MGQRLMRLFVELNRLGTSILFATHDHSLVEQVGAPVLLIQNGELVYHG
jgi:cell division transport system ATP-binding protein